MGLAEAYRSTSSYYGAKVLQHGATALGADWRCEPTQQLRFVQLLKLCADSEPCTLNDLGCGWGALRAYLGRRHLLHRFDYLGIDLAPEMIAAAQRRWPRERHRFVCGTRAPRAAQWSVASGIFNVRLDVPLRAWEAFVTQTLRELHATSRRGFAVNFMVPLEGGAASPQQLYRPPPEQWPMFCRREFGARVERVTGYGMAEETLLVRY